MGHSLETTPYIAKRIRREVAVTGNGRASDWYRAVRHDSLGLNKSHLIPAKRVRLRNIETKDDLGRRSMAADPAKLVCSIFVTTNKMGRWACRTSNKIFLLRTMGS